MKKGTLYILALLLLFALKVDAQSIHFSQYHKTPISYNPANTGLFEGCFRVGTNYRNQWGEINSFTVHLEESFKDKQNNKTQYGIGAYLYQESAGKTGLNITQGLFSFSVSRHVDFDKKHYVSLGTQFGFNQKRLDLASVSFLNQYNNIDEFDISINNQENFNSSSAFTERANIGIKYIVVPTVGIKIMTGFAIQNLTRPNDDFNGLGRYKSDLHRIIHNEVSMVIKDNIVFKSLFLMDIGNQTKNTVFGGIVNYKPKDDKQDHVFEFGGFYRIYDAFILSAGIIKNKHNLAISYDIITSGLNLGRGFNGNVELGYFFTLDCKPKLPADYTLPCIRL